MPLLQGSPQKAGNSGGSNIITAASEIGYLLGFTADHLPVTMWVQITGGQFPECISIAMVTRRVSRTNLMCSHEENVKKSGKWSKLSPLSLQSLDSNL